MYPNVPHTEDDRGRMLRSLGLDSVEDLFAPVPEAIREACRIDCPELPAEGLAEARVLDRMKALAGRNRLPRASFLGAGSYEHYVPASVDHVIRRSEFLTAYTPYQPEVAQGTLQVIFEFQSLVAALTGMEVSNASLYDGASATAEAALLALSEKKLDRGGAIAVSAGVDPRVRRVLETYLSATDTELRTVPLGECGRTSPQPEHLAGVAAFVVGYPNFFGVVEDLRAMAGAAHSSGALLVVNAYPVGLGLLAPPGALGADVVVGDLGCFGNARSFGGPGVGMFAVNKPLVRKVPGRLAGVTLDHHGRRAYVLTLQAREQHIRRARATSNICTNQGLCALAATVHMAMLGGGGIRKLAEACWSNAHWLSERIARIPGYSLGYSAPFFHEFMVRTPRPASEVITKVREKSDLLAGFDLGSVESGRKNELLVAVTERRTREECEALVASLEAVR